MARAQLVRQNCGYIPENAYNQRKAFFVAKVTTAHTLDSPSAYTQNVCKTSVCITKLSLQAVNYREYC